VAGRRNWVLALARHFSRLRSAYPTDRRLVVFEIDGPIVDQRQTVRRRLVDYDRVHGTDLISTASKWPTSTPMPGTSNRS
jgi:hypothetical protein